MSFNSGLPQRISMPPDSIFEGGRFVGYWKYVRGTIEALSDSITLEYNSQLRRRSWSAFEMLVDGQMVVIDYSDFLLVDVDSSSHDHWLRFHHTPAFMPYPYLGSFPPWSFLDWEDHRRSTNQLVYTASGDSIVYRHSSLENRLPNLIQRRTRAEPAVATLSRSIADGIRAPTTLLS